MHLKFYYMQRKRTLIFLAIQLLVGVYIAIIRLNLPESYFIDALYFYAREGVDINLKDNEFDAQVIMSVLDIIVILPIAINEFSGNYRKKIYYLSTHCASFKKFYLNETVNLAAVSFLYSAAYALGIFFTAYAKSNMTLSNKAFWALLLLTIVQSALIIYLFSLVGSVLSVFNGKIGMALCITLFAALAVILFFLPMNLKQYDLVSFYFISELLYDKQVFSLPLWAYYLFVFALVFVLNGFGYAILRKKDTL